MVHRISGQRQTVSEVLGSRHQIVYALSDFQDSTVQQTEDGDGTVLRTEKAVYPLLGGDFAMIIGEEVNVIGKMVRENNIGKIIVARVQFERE